MILRNRTAFERGSRRNTPFGVHCFGSIKETEKIQSACGKGSIGCLMNRSRKSTRARQGSLKVYADNISMSSVLNLWKARRPNLGDKAKR